MSISSISIRTTPVVDYLVDAEIPSGADLTEVQRVFDRAVCGWWLDRARRAGLPLDPDVTVWVAEDPADDERWTIVDAEGEDTAGLVWDGAEWTPECEEALRAAVAAAPPDLVDTDGTTVTGRLVGERVWVDEYRDERGVWPDRHRYQRIVRWDVDGVDCWSIDGWGGITNRPAALPVELVDEQDGETMWRLGPAGLGEAGSWVEDLSWT